MCVWNFPSRRTCSARLMSEWRAVIWGLLFFVGMEWRGGGVVSNQLTRAPAHGLGLCLHIQHVGPLNSGSHKKTHTPDAWAQTGPVCRLLPNSVFTAACERLRYVKCLFQMVFSPVFFFFKAAGRFWRYNFLIIDLYNCSDPSAGLFLANVSHVTTC